MRKCTVQRGQSLIDIAIRYCGKAESAIDIATLNNVSIDTELSSGAELDLPDVADNAVVTYFASKVLNPATMVTENELPKGGVEYWAIEYDFVIN